MAASDDNFRTVLSDLSRLGTGVGPQGLIDRLTHVARFAVEAVPGADGVGVTLLEPDGSDVIVATTDLVRRVDAIQYRLGDGPCIRAAKTNSTMRSGSLSTETAWRRFGVRAARLGVHSVLSVPLATDGHVLGTMNIYARARDAFDERAARLAEAFAVPAAISVQHARALSRSQRLATDLQAAMELRAVIDQAIGVIMSRSGQDAHAAFQMLHNTSQAENRELHVVARRTVDDAIHHGQAHEDDATVE